MRILIVDDEQAIIDTLRPVLVSIGHEVVAAKDGAEALAAVGSSALDLVLLDLGLPDTDGCDLIAPREVSVILKPSPVELRDCRSGALTFLFAN